MEVVAVTPSRHFVLMDTGHVFQVSAWLDFEGDRTSDPRESTVGIVTFPNGSWGSFDLTFFDNRKLH